MTTQAGEGWLPRLLADPPLIDRLTWREGVSPRTLISHDRGLMARTIGTLYLVGALVAGISLLVPDPGSRNDVVLAVISGIALLVGSALFVTYRRTPMWAFQLATAIGSVILAVSTAAGSSGAEGGYAVFYVWVVLLAFLFFSFPAAVLQTVFAAATYAAVLITRDTDFAFNYVLGLVAVSASAGAIVGLLRERVEGLAMNLASQAHTDPLTAIANRRSFEGRFDFELMVADEASTSLSLVICDLDRFKVVNDAMGHEEGDHALRLAASSIVGAVRSVDIVFRLGGEEFAVLLPHTDGLEAYVVAERIRASVGHAFDGYQVPLTVSCGVATRRAGGVGRKELMRVADKALYRAKRAGRNRTVSEEPGAVEPVSGGPGQ